ncbi:MAG: putative Ig domain-containing protein [Planctomycetota bacterium]
MRLSRKLTTSISKLCKKVRRSLKAKRRESETFFQIERLEERQMLAGDLTTVFQTSFEDVSVADGGFEFTRTVGGFTATAGPVEVQNNHPSVGPASNGQNHLELDGTNGIFIDIDDVPATGLILRVDYSARPGVDAEQASIEVLWNGSVVDTLSAEGTRLRSTDYRAYEIELPGGGPLTGRLEFRSNSPDDRIGLGGMLDHVRILAEQQPIAIEAIADQEVNVGSTLNVDANLAPPNETLGNVTFSLVDAPAGATINALTGEVQWVASQANIDASVDEPTTVVGNRQLMFRAGFEEVDVASGGFGFFPEVSGFTSVRGNVEIQDNHPSVGRPSEGNQHLELDGLNAIFRDVATVAGDQYEIVFDYSPRSGVDADGNAIELWWDGQRVERISAEGRGNSGTDYREYRFDLSQFSGDMTRLEFRSNDPDDKIGLGGLLDNIRVYRRQVTIIDPPDDKFNVTVRATHADGRTDTESFQICINEIPVDQPPVFNQAADATINERESIDVFLTATDPDSPVDQLRFEAIKIPVNAELDPVTGQLSWTPNEWAGGLRFNLDVRVTDNSGLSDTQRFRITVNELNADPIIEAIDDVDLSTGQMLSVQATATDADRPVNTLTYSLDGPDGATIDNGGTITWLPSTGQAAGEYSFEVTVEDGLGGSDTETFQVRIEASNSNPVLNAIDDQSIPETDTLSIQAVATDNDQPPQTLTYSLTAAPDSATINATTGLIQWSPLEADGPGEYTFTVEVSDGAGGTDTHSFQVQVSEVNLPPVLESIANQTVRQGNTVSFTATATDADVPANELTYGLSGNVPTGASINPTTGVFSWATTAANNPGQYDINVTVSDGSASDMTTVSVTLTEEVVDEILLTEDSNFESVYTEQFVVSDDTKQLIFDFESAFDTADGFVNDAFEVALLDEAGQSLVHTIGRGRDAFFNLTESQEVAAGVNTVNVGSQVQLDLSHIAAGTTANLVFRLVNNDDDTQTQVRISNIDQTTVEMGTSIGATTFAENIPSAEVDFVGLTDVTGSVVVDYGQASFDQTGTRYFSEVAIENVSSRPIDGPFVLAVQSISDPTVEVTNSDGQTPDGDRYLLLTGPDGSDTLAPGERTVVRSIEFFNPNSTQFDFELALIAQPNVAPDFVSTPNTEGLVGKSYAYQSLAIDQDGDELTYSLMVAPSGLSIDDGSGEITWAPTMEDVGTHNVMVEVIDGRGGVDIQTYDIEVLEERPNRPPVIVSSPIVETFLAGRVSPSVAEQIAAQNLIQNGGFSEGNVGFESDLSHSPSSILDAATYAVVTDPASVHPSAESYSDRSGSGLMLAVNGSTQVGEVVWEQTVNVETDTEYDFAAYVSTWFPGAPAQLEFAINGVSVSAIDAPNETGVWDLAFATWNSGDANRATIQIRNSNQAFTGNDFALDDLYFGATFYSEIEARFIDQTPTDVGSTTPNTFETLPSVDPSIFGFNGDVRTINFDTDASGNPIASGTSLTTEYESLGVVMNNIEVSSSVFGGAASAPNATITPAVVGEGLVFQFTTGMQAVGFINTSPDQDLVEFFDSEGELIFSSTDQDGEVTNFNIDRFIGFTASEDRPIHSMRISNNTGNLEIDELIFVPAETTYTYQVEAVDPDLDPVAFVLDEGPEGMIIHRDTGLISWNPQGNQVGTHTVKVTADDGRGGTATQEYELRVLADPTNTAPVIVSDPIDNFFIPGFSNPASGAVSPQRIALDLGNGETFEGTVSITLPDSASRFADIVLAVDESSSMGGSQAWVVDMIPLLDAALIDAGIGAEPGSPNRFGIIGFGGGRDSITVGHFLNSESRSKYTLYGPDRTVVVEGLLNDVIPDELLNLELPNSGEYVLVVEAQDSTDLSDGIEIGFEGNVAEGTRVEQLELDAVVEDILLPGQPVEYQFDLSAPTLVYFDSLAKDTRIRWTLEGPSEPIFVNARFDVLSEPRLLEAGQYKLIVDSGTTVNSATFADVAADYKFRLLNLDLGQAIESGQTTTVGFDEKAETFVYRFNAEPDQQFELIINEEVTHTGSRWTLVDAEGIVVATDDIDENQPPITLRGGNYFLLMESALSPKEGSVQLRTQSFVEFIVNVEDVAPPIEVEFGEINLGSIDYVDAFVDYSFTLNGRSLVYFDSLIDSSLTWTLTGPSGVAVSNLAFGNSDSFNQASPVYDLVAGDYQLRINSNNRTGDFAFRVLNLKDAVEITPGVSFDGELATPSETDMYRFDANAGDAFYFDVVTSSDDRNTQFKLIDPYGQVVFISSRLTDVSSTTLPSSGTYTLLVEGWKSNVDIDTYTMNVVPVTESTTALTLGDEVTGNLATPGQRAIYTFDLTDTGLLYFDSLTNDLVKNWTLEGPRGVEIDSRVLGRSDSFDQNSAAVEIPAGSYRLIISGLDSTGDYGFRLSNLLDDTQTTPITPNPGSANPSVSISDSILGNESKLYRMEAESGDEFSFVTTVTGSTNVSYRVLDAFGQIVTANSGIATDRPNQRFIIGGTYFLLIEGRASNELQSDVSFDIEWIQNNGPVTFTGTPLTLNSTVNGNISTNGQIDSYTFTLTERTLLYMDVLTNNSSLRWSLKGPKGQFPANVAFTSTDGINSLNSDLAEFGPGEYQLDIFGSGTPGGYGFRMVDLSSAVAITPGTSFSGQLDPSNETDFYQFDANDGDQFYIDVESTSDRTGALYKVIDPYGDVVVVSPSGRLDPLSSPFSVANSGTFTLLVEGKRNNVDNDTYTLNLHTISPAFEVLTLGEIARATIETPGDEAKFTFSIADRKLVHFDSLFNSRDVNWTLAGPSGTVVDSRRFNSSDSFTINDPILDLPVGDYTLTVDAVGNLTGVFDFALLDLSAATAVSLGDKIVDRLDVRDGLDAVWTTGAGLTGAAVDGAIDLSNTFDSLSIPSETLNGVTDLTIEFWYKTDKTGFQTFLSGANSTNDNELLVFLNDSTNFEVSGVGDWDIDSVADGQWHHYAITAEEGVGTTFYLDGVNQGLRTSTLGELSIEPGGLFFGQEQDVFAGDFDENQTADGQLDELRIWTQARTEAEVQANKDAVVAADSPGLTAYFGFDETSGNIAPDQTTNGFDATYASLTTSKSTKGYKFDSEAGDIVFFNHLSSDRNFNVNAYWRLVDQFGNTVFNQVLSNDAGPITLEGGTYVLFVEGQPSDSGFNGGFEFDIVYLGNQFNPVPPTELTLGETIEDEISVVRETDRYSFTLDESSTLYFDVLSNDGSMNWSLKRDGREVITDRLFNLSDSNRTNDPLLSLSAGSYELSVTSIDAEPYSFRLLKLDDATEVQLNTPFGNTFATADQTDVYRFSGQPGDRIYIDVLSVTSRTSVNYRLVGPNDEILARQLNFDDNDVVVLEEAGDYYLLVEGDHSSTVLSEYEVNLVSADLTTTALVFGETITDSITKPGDSFAYEFSLADDAQLVFDSLTDERNFNWSLDGPFGNIVSERSFDRSDSFDFNLPVIDLDSGDYVLTVTGVLASLGDFSFRLLDIADGEAITPGTTIGGGDVEISTETLVYKFDASAGQAFLIDVESASESSTSLYRLIDPQGAVVNASSNLTDNELMPLTQTGTYTLLVEGRRNNVDPDTFSINLIELTERDGGELITGSTVTGTIARGETVAYQFSLATDGLVHFDSHLSDNDFNWTLEGPRGIEVESRGFGSSDSFSTDGISRPPVAFELLAGEYKLTVDAVDDVVGDYSFALLNLLDLTQSTLVDNPVSGSPTTIDEVQSIPQGTQAYRFDAVAGDQLTFDSTANSAQASYRLIDQFGKQLFREQTQRSQSTELLLTGTYFLLVEGQIANDTVVDYEITITHTGNTPLPGLSGDALTLGTTQSGDLSADGQIDSYTFTLTERSALYFDSLTNSSAIRWRLSGPRGVELTNVRFDQSNVSSDFLNPGVQVLIAGDYQLDIFASSGTPGAYAFTMFDLAMATELTPGTELTGDLTDPLETDIYKFDANAGESFYFDVEPTGNSSATFFKLIDPFGRVVSTSNRFNDLEPVTLEFDGTYSLLVNPVQNYTINVVPVVNPTSELEFDTTTTANLGTAGATQSYTFVLDQEQSLFFNPGSSESQFTWTLSDAEREIVGTTGFNSGFAFLDLDAGEYTVTIDSLGDYVGEISFYTTLIDVTDEIATDGTITSGLLTSDQAAEVYTFSGVEGERLTLLPDYSIYFTDSATASETARKYILGGDPEDGYSGVTAAIRADVFREGAAINYILVTDEDRDVQEDEITFESLFADITSQSALLNIISSSQFRDDTNTRAIGVDDEGTAYIADGAGGFTVGTGGITTQTNVSILQDYINLAWATNGANWDLGLLRAGGVTAESFTNAFIDVKVSEIQEQTALRLIPSNLEADFEVTDPTGGLYTDVVAGGTYDFEIRIGDNTAISYDLLFNQGQTLGSIPVFVISPYAYGASAVDADGDTLTWSIVTGPEGIMIDEGSGVLIWTADDVLYGEHDVTIRVDDGRGGFDEQTFVLEVSGGEAATISGRVVDFGQVPDRTVNAIVRGNSDPYLAGLPDGATASAGDVAPDHSPVLVEDLDLIPGTTLTFNATGWSSFSGGSEPADPFPDGSAFTTHATGAENGLSNYNLPIDALIGVFLSDADPRDGASPEALDFSDSGNVEGGVNYLSLAPELQQIFFIGDGVTSDDVLQEIVIPEGATRLYLGTSDGTGWFNNTGLINVEVTGSVYEAGPEGDFVVFLDQNRNGLRDTGEAFEQVDESGDFTFESIAGGSYVVHSEALIGYRLNTPNLPSVEVSVNPGEDVDGIFFGYDQVPLVNTNPEITSTAPSAVEVGFEFEYDPTIVELDGDDVRFDLPLAPAGMVVNPENGSIRWTPTIDQVGLQSVLLRVRDDFGGFDLQFIEIQVAEPNTAPVITTMPPTGPAGVGLPYEYNVAAVDSNGDVVTFALVEAPNGMTINPTSGRIQWTPNSLQVGEATIVVEASDGRGLSSTQTFTLSVELAPANVDPEFLSEPSTEVRLGDRYLYKVVPFDQNGDPITLTLDSGPSGMTIDTDENLIVWEPNANQLGASEVVLKLDDGRGGVALQTFSIEVTTQPVNLAPEITSPPKSVAIVDQPYRFTATATDPNNDVLIWSLEQSPLGMAVDPLSGQVSWDPTIDQLGEYDVRLQVTDTYGAFSQLVYRLQVRSINTPPIILSNPPTSSRVGTTYLYQVQAEDADQDRLRFELLNGPEGMTINSDTGRVQWSPTAAQVGTANVEIRVSDPLGANVTQTYTNEIGDGTANQLPVITSTPGFFATLDQVYEYQVEATDADGDPLVFALLDGPDGATIDETTGLLSFLPDSDDLGTTIVELAARDPEGGGSLQSFSLTVLESNNAPEITSTPRTELASGEAFRYDILATDADNDFLTYQLLDGPDGMLIDGVGRMFWIPGADQIGNNDVRVRVSDPRGGFAEQEFTLVVSADTEAPRVAILLSDNPIDVGGMVDIRVSSVDNVGIESLVLTIDGVAVPLDANGNARIQLDEVGSVTALATAIDAAGNEGTDSIQIFVADPNDVDGPVISISSPGDGDSITAVTDVIGTVTDDTLVSYRLFLAEFGTRQFTEISVGTENVTDGVLGQIDPTLLQNGSYVLRLEAVDAGGNQSVIEQSVEITGNLKLGNFQLAFTDLVLPISGIPIEVTRIYDSLQSDVTGEIGFGWRLEFRDTDLRVGLPESGLEDIGIFSAYRPGTRVYLNVPGEGRQGFTFDPSIRVLPGFGNSLVLATPKFTADPGVSSTLSVARTGNLIVNEFGELSAGGGIPYNPASPDFGGGFILTTEEGVTYRIDGTTGQIDTATDRNGNTLNFSDTGVVSDSGVAIEFEKDVAGKITRITDPNGNSVQYAYDEGRLISSTDRLGNETQYVYDSGESNFLSDVIDPLGRTGIRTEYDENGRMIGTQNVRGAETSFSFDPDNFLVESEINGRNFVIEYDNFGNVISTTDEAGNQIQNTFDSQNNLLSTTTPLGEVTQFVRDAGGNIIEQIDPRGNSTRFTFNQNDDLTSVIDALGNATEFTYDAAGNLTSMISQSGTTTTFEYDNRGNQISVTDANGNSQTMEFDSFGNPIVQVDALGNRREYRYDSNGNSTGNEAVILLPDGEMETFAVSFEIDANGNQTSIIAPDGSSVQQAFDPLGRITQITDQDGRVTSLDENDSQTPGLVTLSDGRQISTEFSLNDQPIAQTNLNGHATRYEYDLAGNLARQILPDDTPDDESDNPIISYEYDGNQRLTAVIDSLGNRTEYEYDASGNQILIRDALGRETRSEFNALGQATATIDSRGQRTEFVYDDLGQLIVTRFENGSQLTQSYDAVGNLVEISDALGATVSFEYDANNRLIAVTDANGNRTSYDLDQFGNVIRQTDALGRETRFEYDEFSRRTATIRPNGERSEVGYTRNNRVEFKTDFAGNRTDYVYDESGRLEQINYEDGSSDRFELDNEGNITSIEDSNGLYRYQYDELNRLVAQTNPDGTFLKYTYDSNSNVTSIETPGGTTQYAHNALNQLVSVTASNGELTNYQYDEVGNRIRADYENGNYEVSTFDILNRLVKLELFASDDSVILATDYEYDAVGQVTEITRSDGNSSEFIYDGGQQLIQETHVVDGQTRAILYAYDDVGNRIEKSDSVDGVTTYVFNANDQLIRTEGIGAATLTYDADGNLSSQQDENGDITVYEWNSVGELISATVTVNGVTEEISYDYDPAGNRISRTDTDGEIKFLIDNNRESAETIEEYTSNGDITTNYLVDDEGVFASSEEDDYQVLHRDRLNSVYLISNAGGATSGEYFYDAFGNTLLETSPLENEIQFNAQYRDDGTDLLYLRARNLDTATGRFISTDPFEGNFENPRSLHRYIYAGNNPTNATDPSGEVTLAEITVRLAITGVLLTITQQATAYFVRFTTQTNFAGPQISISGSPEDFVGKNLADESSIISAGTGVGGQLSQLGTNNAPNVDNQSIFDRSIIAYSFTVFASASASLNLLNVAEDGLPGGGGVGGINIDIPSILLPKAPQRLLLGGYTQLAVTAGAGVGFSPAAPVYAGYGNGTASGLGGGSLIGAEGEARSGVTIFVYGSERDPESVNTVRGRFGAG